MKTHDQGHGLGESSMSQSKQYHMSLFCKQNLFLTWRLCSACLYCGKHSCYCLNLGSNSHSTCPSINCTRFTGQKVLEMEILPMVVPYHSTPLPIFVGDNYDVHWFISNMQHYDDVIMSTIASQITSLTIVYSTVYSGADQSKHQSSASLAFVWGIHRGPVNSPHKWPVTRKMFPFDDVIMKMLSHVCTESVSLLIIRRHFTVLR